MVGAIACCTLFHPVCDLKFPQMNVQYNLIQQFLLYKFIVGHKSVEATKKICCGKDEVAVDYSRVTI